MLGRYLKNKFGKDTEVPATEQFYTPLRIGLHSTVSLQLVDMLVLGQVLHPSFVAPKGDLEVLAIGTIDDSGTPIHQVYVKDTADEEFILQIVEGKDYRTQEPMVDEITLYRQVVTLEPETETSLDRYLNDIGFDTMELDDVAFNRLWGDDYTEKADFRKFEEDVITPAGKEHFMNDWLLYGREIENPIGDENVVEFLLVGIEESNDVAQIMMQLGLKLDPTDVTVQ